MSSNYLDDVKSDKRTNQNIKVPHAWEFHTKREIASIHMILTYQKV